MTTETRRAIRDLSVMVAGQGGDGTLTVASLVGSLLGRRGFHLYSARNIASRARGGHAAGLLRGSLESRQTLGDKIQLLVAFDEEAIERAGPMVAGDGVVIFDSSNGDPPAGHLPGDATVIPIPFGRIAVRDLRQDLFKNSLSFGVASRVLGADDDEAEATLRARFRRQPDEVIEANVRALRDGFAQADAHGFGPGASPWRLERAEAGERIFLSGNEAIALGFVAAGGRFYAGYPITPASEILSTLASVLPRFDGVAVQAEDELSAINMAMGAALTGTRAMVGSSGPGISLMQEGVSHAGSAEIPVVVVDVQRAGPSTGMPTKPEQSDINMLVHGGNGDFPRVVLSPGDLDDCFDLAVAAVNLAQRLQGPVYIALDQALGQNSTTTAPFDFSRVTVESGRRLDAAALSALPEYRRYASSDDGVSAFVTPGTPGGMNLVTGNERNEWGQVSSEPGNRVRQMDKRMRKMETVLPHLPTARQWGEADAAVGLLGIGMELGAMLEATEELAAAGLPVAGMQPRTLWPVLPETIAFVTGRERVYVVEHNAEAQLAQLLASVGAPRDRIRSILAYDGTPLLPGELAARVLQAEGKAP